ncbi:MAG: hypothetical protein IAF38_16605 [Bacteroidia bacterium]|nr:hypothetical protein [Bacteroidia bacterium]
MKFSALLFIIPFTFVPGKKISFGEKYPRAFKDAVEWSTYIQPEADSICKIYGQEYKKMLPVVLPECARYSIFSDLIECTANEYLYVNFGKDYANFSIGRFQMKPSFIENLETTVKSNLLLSKFNFIADYGNETDDKKIRTSRLDRLESRQWQLKYMCCFYAVVELKFNSKSWISEEEKTEFFALSYNRGFWNEEKEIARWKHIYTFPTGQKDSINNFSYGEVALEFLNHQKNPY